MLRKLTTLARDLAPELALATVGVALVVLRGWHADQSERIAALRQEASEVMGSTAAMARKRVEHATELEQLDLAIADRRKQLAELDGQYDRVKPADLAPASGT